jgi:hypothetical protein
MHRQTSAVRQPTKRASTSVQRHPWSSNNSLSCCKFSYRMCIQSRTSYSREAFIARFTLTKRSKAGWRRELDRLQAGLVHVDSVRPGREIPTETKFGVWLAFRTEIQCRNGTCTMSKAHSRDCISHGGSQSGFDLSEKNPAASFQKRRGASPGGSASWAGCLTWV